MSKKATKLIECGNPACRHMLTLEAVANMYPKPDTPEDRIHRFVAPTEIPGSVMCYICGHYTIRRRSAQEG